MQIQLASLHHESGAPSWHPRAARASGSELAAPNAVEFNAAEHLRPEGEEPEAEPKEEVGAAADGDENVDRSAKDQINTNLIGPDMGRETLDAEQT